MGQIFVITKVIISMKKSKEIILEFSKGIIKVF